MKSRKVLALLLTFAMVFGSFSMVAADTAATEAGFADMPDNWSTAALNKAVENKLLSGYEEGGERLIKADNPLTRAEMAAVVNRAFASAAEADISKVTDVAASAWYAKDMAKAIKMGTFALDTKMRPSDKITRQEAFAVLARAFKLTGADADYKALDKFTDKADIATWALKDLDGLATAGYVQGNSGKLNPKANITRAEFAVVMDNLVKQYIDEAGTVTEVVASGNVMVRAAGVTLKDVTVKGDLIIADGVGDGDVTLDSVTVEGRTVVRGGGENSIRIIGNSNVQNIIIARVDGQVRVYAEDGTEIGVVVVDGSDDVIIEGDFASVTVLAEGVTVAATKATIANAAIEGENSNIVVGSGSTINNLAVNGANATVTANAGARVNNVEINANGATVAGGGTVSNVTANANNATVNTVGTVVKAAEGTTGVTAGGNAVAPGTEGTVAPAPSTGGGSKTIAVSAISVTGDAVVGATLTANPTPSNATSVTYQWQANTGDEEAFENIEGATAKIFVIPENLVGKKIQVVAKGVSSSTATSAPVGPVKALSTATITLDGETDHSNDKYGNEVTLGADLKVTGTLKYHETDPTGMGFADYDHHFLVFKIAGLPEAGAEVTIKGLAEEEASETKYTFTSDSDVVIWGVEANENIEITVNYGDGFEAMVYTLDLDGVTLLVDGAVAMIGTEQYTSLAAAVAAVPQNGTATITLLKDITLTESLEIPEGKTVNLDLNGKTISNDSGYVLENKGDLTIDGNGTLTGLGIIRSTAGKVTVNSGNFYASSRWQDNIYQHTLKAENTEVVINGGNFDATEKGQTNAVLSASTNSTITINGGIFKNVDGDLGNFDPYLFTYEKNGKVIINDGTFYGGWRFNGETATTDIYGGNFTVGFDGQSFHANSTHVLTVYGGTFVSQTYAKLTTKLDDIVDDESRITTDAETGTKTVTKLTVIDGILYDGTTLYKVPADYAGTTVSIAEGTTALANGAFAEAGVTEVTIPAAVTDFGATGVSETGASGGAFKGSAVTTVVLEEGMIEIPAAAFNGATELTSVNIPASVKTIGINAFRQTALTELTIPATVTTIGFGAFRDMPNLTTVTVEGDALISSFAFRSCPKLETVYLNGQNVTFQSGKMIFSHADTGADDGITVYVANADVEYALNAVQKEDDGFKIVVMTAQNGDEYYSTLQEAVDAAKNGDTVTLLEDITEDITITQKADVKFTIDGAGKKFSGVMVVDGKSARYETAGVTIQNVNFEAESISADAYIRLGNGENNTRYTNNVTVKDCTFSGTGIVAVKSYTGGDWNLTLDGLTVNEGMHSMLQVTNVEKGLEIIGCKVYSKNGVNLNNTPSMEMSGCTFDVKGYAVRFGVGGTVNAEEKTFEIENSTLKSACDDGDAVIIFRDSSTYATLDLTSTTLDGTTQFKGNTDKTTILYDGKIPVAEGLAIDPETGAYEISSAAGLFNFAKQVNEENNNFSGKTVKLVSDIDLANAAWTPIGQTGATEFRGVFDGQNYTISNLNIDSSAQTGANYSSGLFGWSEAGAQIKNVEIDGATVKGNHNVAVIVGYTYSNKITNCHVSNADIVCTHANNDACGDKTGIIVGYAGDESRISNCSATDCTVVSGRDGGQLIGAGYNVSVSECTATNVTVTAGGDCTGANINEALIGRVLG